MDLLFIFSLIAVFAASLLAERAAFPAKDTLVVRFLRAFGIYAGLLIMAAYFCTYYLPMALSPTVILLFAVLIAAISLKFGKRGAQTDYSLGSILPALAVFAAALLLFLVPSVPSFLPISYGPDAAAHFFSIQKVIGNLLNSQPPMPHIDEFGFYSYGFHLLAALHILALGTDPVRTVYPLMVAVVGLIAVAFYAIVYKQTNDNGLAVFAGLVPLVSNFTYEALWQMGTWSQIFAQLIIIIMVLECIEYIKRRDLAVLAVMALCVQTSILTHTFIAVVPSLVVLAVLASGWRKLGAKEVAVFALIGFVFATPFLLEYLNFATAKLLVLTIEGGVNHDLLAIMGIPLLLVLSVGAGYLLRQKSGIRDDWALRSFALATLASLIAFFAAAQWLGFGWYWYYKLWLLAAYPLLIYAILVLDRMIELASRFTRPLLHSSKGYARFMALTPVLLLWLFYPIATNNAMMKNYHLVLSEDEYSAIQWVNNSQGIATISPVPDYVSSYYWIYWLSGKVQGASVNSTCYFYPFSYSLATNDCVAGLISSSDSQTAVFVQNYKAVTGHSLTPQRLVVVSGVCVNVLFSSGNATVLSKARNTNVRLDMALTEGNTTREYPAFGCASGCLVPMDANQTGTLIYNFTLNETPERIYLSLFEPAFMGHGTTSVFVSTDGGSWARLPMEDLRPVAYDTQDMTELAGASRTFHVKVEFTGVEFERVVQLLGAGGGPKAVELVGCAER